MAACVPNAARSVSNDQRGHAETGINTGQNGLSSVDLVVELQPMALLVMFVRVSAAQMFRVNHL